MAADDVARCKADMAVVTAAVEEIRAALEAARPFIGGETWEGAAADTWARQWEARRGKLSRLLERITEEQSEIISRVQKDTSA